MTALFVLAVLAVTLALASPHALVDRMWAIRAPRVGVAVWLLTLAAAGAAAVGVTIAAVVPLLHHLGGVRELLHRCPEFFDAVRSHPAYVALAATGWAGAVAFAAAAVRAVTEQLRTLRHDALRHRLALVAAGQRDRRLAVVPSAESAAWSVAVDGGYVVVTTAAVRSLSEDELRAVVAHEAAHLRGRHHLLIALLRAASKALPCPLTKVAVREVGVLLEMRADDVAAQRHRRATVAAALLRVNGVTPVGVLAANGGSTVRRLERLLAPFTTSAWSVRVAVTGAATLLMAPLLVITVAVADVVALHVCPLPS